jgi:hypothetical protein
MALFSVFKARKPRQFEYQPRYWDPRKEALQERIKQIEQEIALGRGDNLPPARTIRKGFIRDTGRSRTRQNRSSNLRILLILAILLLFFYLYLYR